MNGNTRLDIAAYRPFVPVNVESSVVSCRNAESRAIRTAVICSAAIASASTPPASEHATRTPAQMTGRGSNSFFMSENMALLNANRNCCGLVLVRAERVALVDTAGIPQHPRVDAELFGGANLLADLVRGVARLPTTERERLKVWTNRGGAGHRP